MGLPARNDKFDLKPLTAHELAVLAPEQVWFLKEGQSITGPYTRQDLQHFGDQADPVLYQVCSLADEEAWRPFSEFLQASAVKLRLAADAPRSLPEPLKTLPFAHDTTPKEQEPLVDLIHLGTHPKSQKIVEAPAPKTASPKRRFPLALVFFLAVVGVGFTFFTKRSTQPVTAKALKKKRPVSSVAKTLKKVPTQTESALKAAQRSLPAASANYRLRLAKIRAEQQQKAAERRTARAVRLRKQAPVVVNEAPPAVMNEEVADFGDEEDFIDEPRAEERLVDDQLNGDFDENEKPLAGPRFLASEEPPRFGNDSDTAFEGGLDQDMMDGDADFIEGDAQDFD